MRGRICFSNESWATHDYNTWGFIKETSNMTLALKLWELAVPLLTQLCEGNINEHAALEHVAFSYGKVSDLTEVLAKQL